LDPLRGNLEFLFEETADDADFTDQSLNKRNGSKGVPRSGQIGTLFRS
jgi:hypothetical protein